MNSQSPVAHQRPTQPVEIIAIGMITSIGMNAEMTATSVRAGISGYQESDVLNKNYNPMTLSLVPDDALSDLDDELKTHSLTNRQQRMLRLAKPAMEQIREQLTSPTPLMLCGPEKLPGRRSIVSDKFLKQLKIQTKAAFDLENSYVFPQGRASGLYALEAAMQVLESGSHKQVLVGGVDSFLDLHLLGCLDSEDRVLAEGVMDGFSPGEAAAFLLLKSADSNSKIKIYPPGIADEVGHRYSKEPYKGDGLANAVAESLSAAPVSSIKSVFSSFNGEHFNAKEWGVAAIRNEKFIDDDFNIIHPADCYGDIGAATAPVLMALASLGMQQGYYHKPSLVWASSEVEQRAAVYMS